MRRLIGKRLVWPSLVDQLDLAKKHVSPKKAWRQKYPFPEKESGNSHTLGYAGIIRRHAVACVSRRAAIHWRIGVIGTAHLILATARALVSHPRNGGAEGGLNRKVTVETID